MSGWIIPKELPLEITLVVGDAMPIIVQARMTAATARCPGCGRARGRVHSHYWRAFQDLPWQTLPVRWLLTCRKFWCDQSDCPRTIFCERLPPTFLGVRQQRTQAVWQTLTEWGWTARAADGARVATHQGLGVSADTVIRALRAAPDPPTTAVRVVGLDEWAKRKGRTYATVLVDQERHRIVDVLPDDQPETVAAWLQAHPTIPVVTRDRDEAFAQAIAAGAPDATQVADRFHLLFNLGALLERIWARLRPAAPVDTPPDPPAETTTPPPPQQALWATMQRLTAVGWSVSAMARHLHLTRKTVRKYQQAPTCPIRALPPPRRRPVLDTWTVRREGLWPSGEHHATALYRTIHAEGYPGSLATITHWVQGRRGPALPPERPVSARAFATWCLLPWDRLSRKAGRRLTPYLAIPELRRAYTLAHLFRTVLRARRPPALTAWLQAAEPSGIPEFGRFVAHLRRDLAAVQAATTEPWSQGPVEGFHHKIKRLKRVMYGRAKFDLLRQRILHAVG